MMKTYGKSRQLHILVDNGFFKVIVIFLSLIFTFLENLFETPNIMVFEARGQ